MSLQVANRIVINFPPLHPGQVEVKKNKARFKVLVAGRRFGKTLFGCLCCLEVAAQGYVAWWIAPEAKTADIGWRMMKRLAKQMIGPDGRLLVQIREADRMIVFPNNGFVQVRSAHEGTNLRGEGLKFAVFDECAMIRQNAWTEEVRPALSDFKGSALFISTPKGHNWFHRLWMRGNDPLEADWQSFQFPTTTNPFIDPSEIEDAKRDLTELEFQQEYLAQFNADGSGLVFRNLDAVHTSQYELRPRKNHSYVMGIDWGKIRDFTVVNVFNEQHRAQVAHDRFNQIDYRFQLARIAAMVDLFKPRIIVAERNSIGEPIIEQMHEKEWPVHAFDTTNASKKRIIENLALACEKESIKLLPIHVQRAEMEAFSVNRTKSGLITYGAPDDDTHDDCVMSLAFAWEGIVNAGVPNIF